MEVAEWLMKTKSVQAIRLQDISENVQLFVPLANRSLGHFCFKGVRLHLGQADGLCCSCACCLANPRRNGLRPPSKNGSGNPQKCKLAESRDQPTAPKWRYASCRQPSKQILSIAHQQVITAHTWFTRATSRYNDDITSF